ncbi:hypothetical protein GCM10016455_12070 [Aliiroseovarius zhejiangensis]|uniref:Class I SAM-dependent methyltransferase n=1 Tax=Aliiroseovarius zhejiangensis TaxID=1632025 RepID=A0ABQ3ISP2_9RHOB|nr:class I SAM-dependent methyltransferase [Aliiroseovarius zhejiangensis]GHE93477.1 hypothetical protein GCM10016455_12070 [Aliiroseovarius zhejiangensis]
MARRIAVPNDLSVDARKATLKVSGAAAPFPQTELWRLDKRRYILETLAKGSVGAEIGVFRGHFADVILDTVKPSHFYMIDPWTLLGDWFGWGNGKYVSNGALTTRMAKDEACLRAANHPGTQTTVIEGFFPDCAPLIDHKLDWAYLDASHGFQETLAELRALARLVKRDGAILGDDWRPDPTSHQHGVFRAVQKFVAETNWQIVTCGPAGQWMIKRKARRG